jgi:colanic acid biosynthesis glycosyl transferase WcaI
MGKAQDLDTVLDAARLCADRNPAIQFVFVGGGIERARLESQSCGASNVLFLPARPASEMAPLLSMSQVLLVHLKDDPLFEITIPSKTQAYMAAGKPILMSVRGDAAEMVSAAGAGVVSPPGNSTLLAEAALGLAGMDSGRLESMGAAGREYYFRELSFNRGVSRFEELFIRVAESR